MTRSAAPGEHLTDRQLDDFVAGRLRGEPRQSVLAHLDACPSCFDHYADVAHVQAEVEPVARRTIPVRRLTAVAAAALLAVVAGWLLVSRSPQGSTPMATALLAATEPSELAAELGSRPDWDGQRTSDLMRLDPRQLAFRLGVTTVALDVALAADDSDGALALLDEQLLPLVRAWAQRGLVEPIYSQMAVHLRASGEPAELGDDAARAAQQLDRWLEGAFRLGVWAEAGRLAARTEGRKYFHRRAARPPALDPATDVGPGATEAFEAAVEAAAAATRELDSPGLSRAFDHLVLVGGGGRSSRPVSL